MYNRIRIEITKEETRVVGETFTVGNVVDYRLPFLDTLKIHKNINWFLPPPRYLAYWEFGEPLKLIQNIVSSDTVMESKSLSRRMEIQCHIYFLICLNLFLLLFTVFQLYCLIYLCNYLTNLFIINLFTTFASYLLIISVKHDYYNLK